MATIDITATGAKIHDMAKAAGFTAKDFADACCLTNRNAVYKWFRGACMPTIDNFVIIAGMLGTTIDNLVVVVDM